MNNFIQDTTRREQLQSDGYWLLWEYAGHNEEDEVTVVSKWVSKGKWPVVLVEEVSPVSNVLAVDSSTYYHPGVTQEVSK